MSRSWLRRSRITGVHSGRGFSPQRALFLRDVRPNHAGEERHQVALVERQSIRSGIVLDVHGELAPRLQKGLRI